MPPGTRSSGTRSFPRTIVAGQDFNHIWDNSVSVASGPFKFQSWQKGTQLTLVKNPAFKAGTPAKLDKVVFRYIPSTPSIFQALQSGEIQVTEPQPQIQINDIRKNSKFNVQGGAGYQWAHVDMQFGPKGAPALKKQYVRQALILGMNRAQIRQALYVTPGIVAVGEAAAGAAVQPVQDVRAVLQAELRASTSSARRQSSRC